MLTILDETIMILAGIDLAWTENHPTGIAYGKLEGNTVTVTGITHCLMTPTQICSDLIKEKVMGVAIDAPLIINNKTGMRECELSIGREFGSRKASCMPANLNKYPDHPGVELATQLVSEGFSHLKGTNKWQVECYPHPAIINIFGLPERLKYKKKKGVKVADQQRGLHRLGSMLRSLASSPVLKLKIPNFVQITDVTFDQEYNLSGRFLKAHEDKLDAIVCLYMAALHTLKHTNTHGSIIDGYIVVPKEQSYLDSNIQAEDWNMAPWAVEMAHKYYLAAVHTWHIDGLVSMTNAALAIEILLKSYRLKPTKNIGAINERYSWEKSKGDGHDLSKLFDDLPASIQGKLADSFERQMLYKYRNFFKESRYGYETDAASGFNQTLQTIAGAMILKTVKIYRMRNSTDLFIQHFQI
jgi:predicted RNase H-like nuclease